MPFALFCGWDYEAKGGWDDLGGIFDSVCEAVSACPWGSGPSCEWAHVVDLDARAIILEGRHHSGKGSSGRFYRDFRWTEPK